MKYISTSFFNKYNISTSTPSAKLMVLFQTDPSKRKDLPLVISILKSPDKLFEEELFSINETKNPRNELLTNLKKEDISDSWVDDSINSFKILYKKLDKEKFYHSTGLSEEKISTILESFKDCLFEEFVKRVSSELTNFSSNTITTFFNEVSLINEKYLGTLEDILSEKIELSFSKAENKDVLKSNIEFVCGLPKSFITRPNVYRSYLYFVKKGILENDDNEIKNLYFRPVFKLLEDKDSKEHCTVLVDLVHAFLDIDGQKNIKFDIVKKNTELLANNYVYYFQNIKDKNSKLDEGEFELCIKILGFFAFQNSEWYASYLSTIRRIKNDPNSTNIYNFVNLIVSAGLPKEVYKVFGNMLNRLTNFELEIARWSGKVEKLKTAINLLKRTPSIIRYNDIMGIPQFANVINSPRDVDNLLCKYYYLHYFDPELFTNDAIENIEASAFGLIGFLECGDYMMEMGSGVGNLTFKGLFLKDVISKCPEDWSVGGKTVKSFLRDLGYYTSSYGISKFSSVRNSYDNLFRNASNYIKPIPTETIIQNGKKAATSYSTAISLYKDRKYNAALDVFKEIPDYKDSQDYIKRCEESIQKEEYKKAQTLADNHNYKEASEAFAKLANYKDSEEKAKKYRILYCISVYQSAKQYYDNKQYREAINLLNEIKGEYPDADILYSQCFEEYGKIKYKEAVELFENKKYDKALEIFKEISSYLDSSEYISKCEKEIQYAKDIKVYNEAEKLSTSYSLNDLEKAYGLYASLAKKSFKDSKEKAEYIRSIIDAVKQKQKNAKKRKKIIIISIILFIVIAISVVVPVSIHAHRQKLYNNLIYYVEHTNGNTYHNDIESILNDLPNNYEDSDKYETEYYYKRVQYLVNNYKSSYSYEINLLFNKIPSNYNNISYIKNRYQDICCSPIYDLLISEIKSYDGTKSKNESISEYIEELPSDYKDVSTIKTQFNSIKSYISDINITYYSDSRGNNARSAYKKLLDIDSSTIWDCSSYFASMDFRSIIYGAEFSYSNYYFQWHDNSSGGGQYLSYNIPNDKSYSKSYYFNTKYENSKLYFYVINQKNSSDILYIFNVYGLEMRNGKIGAYVYINKTSETFFFTIY